MPDWVERIIWWQVYPLGFVGAEREERKNGPTAHRLGQLRAWLDYAGDLGATGLALGPVFASATHGYDTIDHFRIDPRLGDEADFDALLAAARAVGLRVLLDGVFNHVGQEFPAFQRVLREGPQAPEASWFRLSWPHGTAPGAAPDYKTFEGHSQLVALNHDEPAVVDYVAAVMDYWLRRGADGWRLDAAYAVPQSFWAAVLQRTRASHPEAYFVGEVIHGDYVSTVRATGMDAVTQYELWKAIWSSLNDRNLFELAWALERHNGFLDAFAPLTFVGNHDVTRIASQLTNERHLPHALAVLFACGGTPSVYAGDEQALRGFKEHRAGGDDVIRPPFPEVPTEMVPDGWNVYRLHQQLIRLRQQHPWLYRARAHKIHLTNCQMVLKLAVGDAALVLALNLADESAALPAPSARSVEAGICTISFAGRVDATIQLPAYGWAILST